MSYKRRKVLRALHVHGVSVLREGSMHTIIRSMSGRQSSLPRHSKIDRITMRKIAKQLELDWQTIEKELQ
jgi:hypothetical protein